MTAADESSRDDLREVAPRVYAFPLFTPERCAQLLAEIDAAEAAARAAGRPPGLPNSLHEHGAPLAPLGFTKLLDELLAEVVRPRAARLFADLGGAALDGHHGFVADYAEEKDDALAFHVDDSEVTLNVCLGERFEGAELTFLGLRCPRHRQLPVRRGERVTLTHVPGVALLHAGCHRHQVEPIVAGRRRNLILWCRASSWRTAPSRGDCGPFCGDHVPPAPAEGRR